MGKKEMNSSKQGQESVTGVEQLAGATDSPYSHLTCLQGHS